MSFQNIGRFLICLLCLIVFSLPRTVEAHPADMYFQTCTIDFSSEGITLIWEISPGPMLSPSTWYEADLDNDRVVSPDEALLWVEPILKDITMVVNESHTVDLILDSTTWPNSFTSMEIGDQVIEIRMHADYPPEFPSQKKFNISTFFMSGSSSYWFTITSSEDIHFTPPEQDNNTLYLILFSSKKDADESNNPDDLLTYWDSGVPEIDPANPLIANRNGTYQNTNTDLIQILRAADIPPGLLLIGMLTSIFLGGLHALTPGHGKTIVAAYLIGSRGTIRHALFLGSIVTLTHTGSVMVLGVITLLISQYFLPTFFLPLLEIISGLLILGLGFWLLIRRYLQWTAFRSQRKRFSQAPLPSPLDSGSDEQPNESQTRIILNMPITEIGLPHQHPNIPDPSRVSWRSILTLGIGGGLVPCPDAIAILLIAIAINRVLIGISLITTFSLGMAAILIAIGILMVQSQRLIIRFDPSQRITSLIPIASALVVIILGTTIAFNAIQRESFGQLANIISPRDNRNGNTFIDSFSVLSPNNFTAQTAIITFLRPDEWAYNQLNMISVNDGSLMPLTNEPFGVWDYTVSPDKKLIVYSAPRDDHTNDIKIVDAQTLETEILIACPDAACTAAQFSPDGAQVIYERLNTISSIDNSPGRTRLWWIDVAGGETQPIFKNENLAGYNPRWSPDGQWFSYSAPGINSARLYHLETGASVTLPGRSGGIIDWGPDSKQILISDVGIRNDVYATHLIIFSLDDQTTYDLSEFESAQDTFAAWSPDGQRIAVVRRLTPGTQTEPGDNLWLLQPDGSDAKEITSRTGAFHGRPVWAPDSIHLAYHVYTITQEGFQSGIWILNTISLTETQLTDNGSRPGWIH